MFHFTDLLLLSLLLHLFVCSICDVISKTEDTIRIQIFAYFVSYFTTLKNGTMGLYTTQTKYLHNNLRINFPCPLPFKYLKNTVIILFLNKIQYYSVITHLTHQGSINTA